MIALYIILYVMFHLAVGGAVFVRVQQALKPKCNYTEYNCDMACSHSVFAIFSIIAWPLVIPAVMGARIGGTDKATRIEKRHAKEITEANHKQKLARINIQTLELQEREAGLSR